MSNHIGKGLMTALRSWFATTPKPMVWRCQYASFYGTDDAVLHIARGRSGSFEIYQKGSHFLLHFPGHLRLPADLFDSLEGAKAWAAYVDATAISKATGSEE